MPTVLTCFRNGDPVPATGAGRHGEVQQLRALDETASFRAFRFTEAETADEARRIAGAEANASALSGVYEAFHMGTTAAPPFAPDSANASVRFVNCFRFPPAAFEASFVGSRPRWRAAPAAVRARAAVHEVPTLCRPVEAAVGVGGR